MGIIYWYTRSLALEIIFDVIIWLLAMIILSLTFHKDIFGYLLTYGTIGLCFVGMIILVIAFILENRSKK